MSFLDRMKKIVDGFQTNNADADIDYTQVEGLRLETARKPIKRQLGLMQKCAEAGNFDAFYEHYELACEIARNVVDNPHRALGLFVFGCSDQDFVKLQHTLFLKGGKNELEVIKQGLEEDPKQGLQMLNSFEERLRRLGIKYEIIDVNPHSVFLMRNAAFGKLKVADQAACERLIEQAKNAAARSDAIQYDILIADINKLVERSNISLDKLNFGKAIQEKNRIKILAENMRTIIDVLTTEHVPLGMVEEFDAAVEGLEKQVEKHGKTLAELSCADELSAFEKTCLKNALTNASDGPKYFHQGWELERGYATRLGTTLEEFFGKTSLELDVILQRAKQQHRQNNAKGYEADAKALVKMASNEKDDELFIEALDEIPVYVRHGVTLVKLGINDDELKLFAQRVHALYSNYFSTTLIDKNVDPEELRNDARIALNEFVLFIGKSEAEVIKLINPTSAGQESSNILTQRTVTRDRTP